MPTRDELLQALGNAHRALDYAVSVIENQNHKAHLEAAFNQVEGVITACRKDASRSFEDQVQAAIARARHPLADFDDEALARAHAELLSKSSAAHGKMSSFRLLDLRIAVEDEQRRRKDHH